MCIVLFSYKKTPGYKLILAANRDEFLVRSTASLGYWEDADTILAGRDLEAGGTWLGVNVKGRYAALTNYREAGVQVNSAKSRGELIRQFLLEASGMEQFADSLPAVSGQYRGFNLLFGDQQQMFYYSNRGGGVVALSPGIYGISNHLLDTDWPKVRRGKMLLEKQLDKSSFAPSDLFQLLSDSRQPDDAELPDTGVGQEWERILAPIFIRSRTYGTRSSAVLLIREDNTTEFMERSFLLNERGEQTKTIEKCYTLRP